MDIRKGLLTAAVLAGAMCLTGCTQSAQPQTTAQPSPEATVDPFYVDVQVPYVTVKPEATSTIQASGEGSYISISSAGRVTVNRDNWNDMDQAETSVGYYRQLREGDTGPEVEKLQTRLQELGYFSGAVNGNFDAATREALIAFEKTINVESYGIATARLQELLFSGTVSAKDDGSGVQGDIAYEDMQFGAAGEQVILLQQRLQALGYFAGNINGSYDYHTALAVMRFEAAYGRELTGVATVSMQEYVFSDTARLMNDDNDKCKYGLYIPMKQGDSGAAVALLQQRLSELGYADAAPNGKFNKFTAELLKEFQKKCDLKANGQATEETLERLYAADAPFAQE